MIAWRSARWRELARYPSATAGVAIILALVGVALAAPLAVPYGEALERWRGGEHWQYHPVNAAPAWVDRLGGGRAPTTRVIASRDVEAQVHDFPGGRRLMLPLTFDYAFDDFPSELNLFLTAEGHARPPFVRLLWQTPDGREIPLGGHRLGERERISISQDRALAQRLGGLAPHIGLFAAEKAEGEAGAPSLQTGRYGLVLEAMLFDAEAPLEAELVVYGRVHGIAGTDHQRRALSLALLWGTPVALAFGLIAAVGTTLTTLVIAAVGVWYRGWVDAVIQRLTEVNMILPVLPILVMVGTLYSTSIWLMLGVVVLLGIFSAGIKTYRAMLLPIREAPYIEAARAYGASHLRIVMRYMLPRILPVLVPSFVTLIPTFVFLEASLAVLGLGDPELPTWGKVLNDAQSQSALYNGYVYWVVSPALLLMLTGLGFAMLGFALDRVFNPRLRSL